MMNSLQTELNVPSNLTPFTARRGQLAATKYLNYWHRIRIDSAKGNKIEVHYIDFGNRETVSADSIYTLPLQFHSYSSYAKEYQLGLVTVPNDPHYAQDAVQALKELCNSYPYQFLNSEYKIGNADYVTLYGEVNAEKVDIGEFFFS